MTTSASLSEILDRKISAAYGRYCRGEISEEECNRDVAHLHAQRRPFDRRRPRGSGERHRCRREPTLRVAARRTIAMDLPEQWASKLTTCEQAVAATILRIGAASPDGRTCDKSVGEIADMAGVCVTKVQDTLYIMRRDGDVDILYRPRKGERSLTNVVTVRNPALLSWIRIGGRTGFANRSTSKPRESFFLRPVRDEMSQNRDSAAKIGLRPPPDRASK